MDICHLHFHSLVTKYISMIKTLLIIFLALFFAVNGLNHLFNTRILEEYAHKRSLFSPRFSVITSGIGMLIGSAMLLFDPTKAFGAYGLAAFVLLAAGLIHQFWKEKDPEERMLEFQNFIKNLAITAEMIYLGSS